MSGNRSYAFTNKTAANDVAMFRKHSLCWQTPESGEVYLQYQATISKHTESLFDFIWLDDAISLAARHRIAIILGTPSSAPLAWLISKYLKTLRVDENGRHAEHGNRKHFSSKSPRHRYFARIIALGEAKHYICATEMQ